MELIDNVQAPRIQRARWNINQTINSLVMVKTSQRQQEVIAALRIAENILKEVARLADADFDEGCSFAESINEQMESLNHN